MLQGRDSANASEIPTNQGAKAVAKESTVVKTTNAKIAENRSTNQLNLVSTTPTTETANPRLHLLAADPINVVVNPDFPQPKSNSNLAQVNERSDTQNQVNKKNDLGLAVQFGNSTSFGVQGKVGVADNISIRPEVFFSSGSDVEFNSPQVSNPVTIAPNTPFTTTTQQFLTADYTTTLAFTTNITVGNYPAGTIVSAGTSIPAGFSIPDVGPAGTTIPLGIPATTAKSRPTGTSFGLAVTYDFKLDPQGKSTVYLGPKVAFSSASGSITGLGGSGTLNTNETKIGLVAGVDYAISDGFTIGANATYNFSRSLSGSISANGQSISVNDFIKPAGSAIDFGIRLGYQF